MSNSIFWGVASVIASGIPFACGGGVISEDASAGDAGDAGEDALDDGQYHDVADTRYWSSIDLSWLLSGGFANGGFDGRYVYWHALLWGAEGGVTSPLVRYDTQGPFNAPSSWSKWTLAPAMSGGDGPVLFDGRYVYLGSTGGSAPKEWRYDTHGAFGDAASLSLSDVPQGLDGGAVSGSSAAFDGRFAYFPDLPSPSEMRIRRYDTQGDFKDRFAWSILYTALPATGPAVFAPPYLVFTPQSVPNGKTAFYDTRLPFDAPSSWSSFSLGGVAGSTPFIGAGTDGRFVYYVPHDNDPWRANGLIGRHEISAPLNNPGSWQTFKTTQVHPLAKTFDGHASWDGRFFYFMVGSDMNGGNGAIVVRYDTTVDFESAGSWSAFDMTPILPPHVRPLRWGGGVVFDGEYIYIPVYYDTPIIMRFDARTPAKMPKGFSGTFY